MKTYLECFPCFLNQALKAAKIITDDEELIHFIMGKIGAMLKDIPLHNTPPETGELIYRTISEHTGVSDPYQKIKEHNIAEAKQFLPYIKKKAAEFEDQLLFANKMAIAGNVIDLGVHSEFDIGKEIEINLKKEFKINNYKELKDAVEKAKTILYLGDNAGEAVFDTLLMSNLPAKIYYAVRDLPIINDVTKEDAEAAGAAEFAEIISSGSRALGTILKKCNHNFCKLFKQADLIISKGQGNYEGLSSEKYPIFFLLKAKCQVIASDLDIPKDSIVLKKAEVE
ncbi:MAG: ARMT1-like domain-containing protein [Candidatus Cloacimonadota bacterium]|nr:ARMT1-like domain-containing protein [Candidatus Cloacimonadota bacterium]